MRVVAGSGLEARLSLQGDHHRFPDPHPPHLPLRTLSSASKIILQGSGQLGEGWVLSQHSRGAGNLRAARARESTLTSDQVTWCCVDFIEPRRPSDPSFASRVPSPRCPPRFWKGREARGGQSHPQASVSPSHRLGLEGLAGTCSLIPAPSLPAEGPGPVTFPSEPSVLVYKQDGTPVPKGNAGLCEEKTTVLMRPGAFLPFLQQLPRASAQPASEGWRRRQASAEPQAGLLRGGVPRPVPEGPGSPALSVCLL